MIGKLFPVRVLVRQKGFPDHTSRLKIDHQTQVTSEGFSFVLKRKGLLTFEIEILKLS